MRIAALYGLVLGILAVWRITHLLQAEDGPWDAVVHLRRRAGAGFWGSLLDCFYCLSLWVAAPFALLLGEGWGGRLLFWPALSAGAILLERATGDEREPPPAQDLERWEESDVLLRQTAGAVRDEADRSAS